jgi:hypothetical protein
MRRLIVCVATASLLAVGCGMSPGHLTVSVGERGSVELHQAVSGQTSIQVTVGDHDCLSTKVNVAWDDVAARVRTC